jgi:hypothetical protein
MIGGIDQQIQQRVDAYRNNPQQLMQRYQQNQELIDLLAMQKLKSEKDAAARDMQMQMQATPQTIKQQREAELLGRTKDEMVQQTSGIMQERQKRQQQNMQRTANQGLPQLPAGNMQRMAGGGIVAFAEGGLNDVDAQLKRLIEAALQAGESPEALAERLKDNPNALAILRSMQSQQQASMGERAPTAEGGLASMLPERKPSMQRTEQRGMGTRGDGEPDGIVQAVSSLFDDTGDRAPTRREISEGVSAPQTAPQTTPAATPAVPELAAQPATQPATRQQQMDQLQEIDTSGLAGLKKASLTPRESYEANKSVLSKELLRQQDPEELARQRRQAFLLGGLSNQGRGGLAGAAAASERAREVQKAQKLQGIGSLMGVDEKLMTMDQEAQKMEIEKESNKLLSEIRQGQLTAAQMNSIAGEISSMTEQVESALMTDPTYITLNEQYQEAVEDDNTGMAEQLLRRREQYRQRKIETMYPNYTDLVNTQKELNKKMLGSTGFTVERLSQ